MATTNRVKMFVRMLAIFYKLGQRGLILGKDEPLTKIIARIMAWAISKTNLTDDEIVTLVKASYDETKEKDKKEKEEILKDAADVIEKWSKMY